MIGDTVQVKEHHYPPARAIIDLIKPKLTASSTVFSLSIGGESGSGKSTLSLAVQELLEEEDFKTFILHMDDYFKSPPQSNLEKRIEDISRVGPAEVDLTLLQHHMDDIKKGVEYLKKPLVHYRENVIREVIVDMKKLHVVIAEGTYTTLLERIDCKVFMLRDYHDTKKNRMKRARDPIMPFNETVLELEHQIIREHAKKADIIVDRDYQISPVSQRYGS